jgi:hypothetical protein
MASVVIAGNTSGSVTLDAPAVAGTTVLTLPATSGTVIVGAAGVTSVASGGTGRTTNTAYAVICGGTTTGGAEQSIASVGTAAQVLTSNGPGALPTFQALPASGGQLQTELFTAPGTWTKPASCTQVRVTVVGGGGGSVTSNPSNGGYGGAIIATGPVSAPVSVTVGAGGNSAPGGTSSFGPLVTATGGAQGGSPGSGANGSGSTTGTNIKSGSVLSFQSSASEGVVWGFIMGNLERNQSAGPISYSATSTQMAGTAGTFNAPTGSARPGVGGAVLVEFVG